MVLPSLAFAGWGSKPDLLSKVEHGESAGEKGPLLCTEEMVRATQVAVVVMTMCI